MLFTEDLALTTYPYAEGIPGVLSFTPSSIARGGIEAEPALAGVTSMRIEVVPLTPNLRFWAFVSITNNETQEVTIVSPQ